MIYLKHFLLYSEGKIVISTTTCFELYCKISFNYTSTFLPELTLIELFNYDNLSSNSIEMIFRYTYNFS